VVINRPLSASSIYYDPRHPPCLIHAPDSLFHKDKELLERVQHRFTHLFKDLRQRNYDERLKSLNLWTLEERRNRQDLIEVFKMYKEFTRLSIDELFERDVNIKGTRGHTLRLKKKHSVRDVRRYFFHRDW